VEWLIVGLGNPGGQYEATRHNVGFMVVNRIWALAGGPKPQKACDSHLVEFQRNNIWMAVAKPQTYMNLSGRAVEKLLRHYGLPPHRLVVICDDFQLPLGTLRMRPKGSHGGHNGLGDIIERLGTQDFPRLRIGIGPPLSALGQADYVLSRFSSEELPTISAAVERAAKAIISLAYISLSRVITSVNTIDSEEAPPKEPKESLSDAQGGDPIDQTS
jgi:PTH1 family peptidyl-tRNA hydrolase